MPVSQGATRLTWPCAEANSPLNADPQATAPGADNGDRSRRRLPRRPRARPTPWKPSFSPRLDDEKAQDIVFIDLKDKSSVADGMIVASGRSHRHVGAMADHLLRALKDAGYGKARVEGMPHCDWVLIDAGDVIVHLFRPEVRSFYNIEKIWSVEPPKRDGRGSVQGPVANNPLLAVGRSSATARPGPARQGLAPHARRPLTVYARPWTGRDRRGSRRARPARRPRSPGRAGPPGRRPSDRLRRAGKAFGSRLTFARRSWPAARRRSPALGARRSAGADGLGEAEVSPDRRFGLRAGRGLHGLCQPAGHGHHSRPRQDLPDAGAVRRRAGHRRAPVRDPGGRQEADPGGPRRHADLARSALRLPRPRGLRRHARPDPRRIRRPGPRDHQRGRRGQGDLADGRHAGRQGRASSPATTSPP